MAPQPESPVVGALKGFWESTSKLTVQTLNSIPFLNQGKPQAQVPSPTTLGIQRDIQAEYERPFLTGSPKKKDVDEADAEFSDFNFWRQSPPAFDDAALGATEEYADVNFWKAPQPSLAELEAR